MRAVLPSLLFSVTVSVFLVSPPKFYTDHFACITYPYCTLNMQTGQWTSSLKGFQSDRNRLRESVRSESDDTKCWFENQYCSPTDANSIVAVITDIETPEICRRRCQETFGCKYFTFLKARTQARCHLLRECSLTEEPRCPNRNNCASGNPSCNCPQLTPGPDPLVTYARWDCGTVDPYTSAIPIGTNCSTSCNGFPGQVSVAVQSTCLPGGEWSNTEANYGRGYSNFNWAKPDEGDEQCGCNEVGPFHYNPNEEGNNTRFVCEGWTEERYTPPFTLTSSDRCDLFCDKSRLETFHCTNKTWYGKPDLGFWCFTEPEHAGPGFVIEASDNDTDTNDTESDTNANDTDTDSGDAVIDTDTGDDVTVTDTGDDAIVTDTGANASDTDTGANATDTDTGANATDTDTGANATVTEATSTLKPAVTIPLLLIWTQNNNYYYKVLFTGTTLSPEAVLSTCENLGFKALCPCVPSRSDRCLVSAQSTSCSAPISAMQAAVCPGQEECEVLRHTHSYLAGQVQALTQGEVNYVLCVNRSNY